MKKLFHRYWHKHNSVLGTLDSLTASTWFLPLDQLEQWIHLEQQTPLLPQSTKDCRLYLLNWFFAFVAIRFTLLSIVYHYYPQVDDTSLRLPYYWSDALQLLTKHSFYLNLAAGEVFIYAWRTSRRFHLAKLLEDSRKLRWYLVLVYIEAITQFDWATSTNAFQFLSYLSHNVYVKYQKKFQRALQVQALCIKV